MTIGKLHKWFDERGFGFLKDEANHRLSMFVHNEAFKRAGLVPELNGVYAFSERMNRGKSEAADLELIHAPSEYS